MKKGLLLIATTFLILLMASAVWAAYHHEGEQDADRFLAAYPDMAGSKIDHCALCHTGGEYTNGQGMVVSMGSCQWCHDTYGYDGSGNIIDTLNDYGKDYLVAGRDTDAVTAIDDEDSDGDGYINSEEIAAESFPGNADDDPTMEAAPSVVFSLADIEAMAAHTQFMLMNASRSDDEYVEYTGVSMEDLLEAAGMLDSATGITVFSPDGWSQYHPLHEDADPELYHVIGTYPDAEYHYAADADMALNPTDGWCDYSAASNAGRSDGDQIVNPDGNVAILAYLREGVYLDPGVLNDENKLDGEGPFRVVPPQKNPGPPDQRSTADNQAVTWPYDYDWDHNKGAATRSSTIIRVEPLPEGTTDINVMEAGWDYVDNGNIIIYGAINPPDAGGGSNGGESSGGGGGGSCFLTTILGD